MSDDATRAYERALAYGHDAVRAGQTALGTAPARPRGTLQIVISAGGFAGYADADTEIRRVEQGHWLPTTVDFNETASQSRGQRFSASRPNEFFGPLSGAGAAIGRIAFIGHGSSRALGLSGDTTGHFREALTVDTLAEWQETIDRRIKPKLGDDAVLDIYACRVGVGQDFMKALAQSLGICVRAFGEQIAWCVRWDASRTITSRGKIAPRSSLPPGNPDCGRPPWQSGVDRLIPPVRICP